MVATPHTAFGELLRISLEDSAQYQVRLVQSAKEARSAVEKGVFQLAIVDTAITDEPFVPFCYDLLDIQPGIRLVVVPPDNNPNHPSLGGLIPHGYLNRPFYLPDLIDIVSRLLLDREKQLRSRNADAGVVLSASGESTSLPATAPSITTPPWLQEPLRLQSYLGKELVSTEALAGIVGMNGPEPGTGSLRAAAGNFSEPAAQELSSVIFRYWNRNEKTDLMRFVRLSSDKKDYLVYATQIVGELVLIMVYDNTAPLSQIRPQTKALAQALAARPPDDYLSGSNTVFAVENEPVVDGETQVEQEIPAPEEAAQSDKAAGLRNYAEQPTQPPVYQEKVTEALEPVESAPVNPAAPEDTIVPDEPAQLETEAPASDTVPAAHEPQTEPLTDSLIHARLNTETHPEGDHSEPQSLDAAQAEVETESPEPAEFNESELETDEETIDPNIFNLTAMLGSVPSPDPDEKVQHGKPFASDWVFERTGSPSTPTLPGGYNGYKPSNDHWDAETAQEQPAEPSQDEAPTEENPPETAATEPEQEHDLPQTAPLNPNTVDEAVKRRFIDPDTYPTAPSGRPASMEVNTEPPVKSSILPPVENALVPAQSPDMEPDGEGPIEPLDDTHPSVVTTLANLAQFEPVSPALSLLNYTCVLVPRLPQHYLTGELADKLAVWVQQLCLAFGWRLEGISIRPEYLQWTVQVAPAVSPGNLVRVIRQRTSQHIFSSFPGLATHNPSGDFWAIGYLIVSGAQPPSAQLLRDYIAQTRKRQGINRI